MSLPDTAAIPAPYRERGQAAYETGRRIVDMVWEDLKPSDIMTREAFENVIVANAAIGGSHQRAHPHQRHCQAYRRAARQRRLGGGSASRSRSSSTCSRPAPMARRGIPPRRRPAGRDGRADRGGQDPRGRADHVPTAAPWARIAAASIPGTATSSSSYGDPLMHKAGFLNLKGTLFDSAIMKTCVISRGIRRRATCRTRTTPMPSRARSWSSTGPRTTTTASTTPRSPSTSTRSSSCAAPGPIGYPGAAEVVNMQPPGALLKRGIHSLPCIGDGRQSGTSGTPSILNASPEAAAGGGLALLQTGDRVRIDLNKRTADILLSARRSWRSAAPTSRGGAATPYPASQTPWQELYRSQGGAAQRGHGAERRGEVPEGGADDGRATG